MNILYVNGHPYNKSFHTAVEQTYIDALSKHHSVEILHLGDESFDPVLRFGYSKRMPEDAFITRSQELVLWADHIVFAYPMWWGDAPALLKGWIERVMTPGLTYSFKGTKISQLLKGKTADIIVTSRAVRPVYWLTGSYGVSIFTRNLFTLTGIRKKKVLALGGIGLMPQLDNEKRRAAFLQKVQKRAARV